MPTAKLVNGFPKYPTGYQVVTLPPLWLNSSFKIAFGPVSGWVFTDKEFTLTLGSFTDGSSIQFTEADFTLSDSGTVARLDIAEDDERYTFVAGWYEGHFSVNGITDHWAVFVFEAVTPVAGGITR